MKPHAMIDIETLGTDPDSVILSVGACKFNPWSADEPHSSLYFKLHIDEQVEKGRTISESTLEWWGQQDAAIRDEAFTEEGRVSVVDFYKELNRWLVGVDKIWCQGPQFDMVMLESTAKQFGTHYNWAYWQVCDSRTLFNLMPTDPRKEIQTDLHNAMADAYFQAICVQKVFKYFDVPQK